MLLETPKAAAAPTAAPSPSAVAEMASAATLLRIEASSASGCSRELQAETYRS